MKEKGILSDRACYVCRKGCCLSVRLEVVGGVERDDEGKRETCVGNGDGFAWTRSGSFACLPLCALPLFLILPFSLL